MRFRFKKAPQEPTAESNRRNVLVILILMNLIGAVAYFIAEKRHLYGFDFEGTWAETIPVSNIEFQGDLTVDIWLRINDFPGKWNTRFIEKGSGAGQTEFSIRTVNRDTAEWAFDLGHAKASLNFSYREILPEGKWVRMTAVRDTSAQELRLYVDGKQIARTTYESGSQTDVNPSKSIISIFGNSNERVLPASLFRLAIWSRVLTPKQIRSLGKSGESIPKTKDLIVQWNLDSEKQMLVPVPFIEKYHLIIREKTTEATFDR